MRLGSGIECVLHERFGRICINRMTYMQLLSNIA